VQKSEGENLKDPVKENNNKTDLRKHGIKTWTGSVPFRSIYIRKVGYPKHSIKLSDSVNSEDFLKTERFYSIVRTPSMESLRREVFTYWFAE